MKKYFLPALPHLSAIVIFVALSSIFFAPVFKGYSLRQSDIRNYLGMSKELRDFREANEEQSLWTNSMFGGMPAYQISTVHDSNYLRRVDRLMGLYLPRPVDTLFIAMLGFYILLLCLRVNPWVAIAASAVFGLGSVNILYLEAGHTAKVKAIAYMAPVLGGMYLTYRGKLLAGLAVTALFAALQLSANHFQMSYYLLFLLVFAAIGEAIRMIRKGEISRWLKGSVGLALAGVLAVLPSMSNILTTSEYSKYTTRGETELTIVPEGVDEANRSNDGLDQDYILQYSFARGEFWSMIIPDVKGGNTSRLGDSPSALKGVDQQYRETLAQQNRYWGEQNFSGGAFYFGAAMFMLFILGLVFLKDKEFKWALLALTLLCVFLSWKDVNGIGQFFLDKFPLYSKFRDTKMILVLAMLIIPLIGARFIDQSLKEKLNLRHAAITGGALLALLLVFAAAPKSIFSFMSSSEISMFDEYLAGIQEDVDRLKLEEKDASGSSVGESIRQEISQKGQEEDFIYGLMDELEKVRVGIFQEDVMRTIMFVALAAILALLLIAGKIKTALALPLLGIILLADLWTVDRRYLSNDNLKRSPHWVEKWQADHPFQASEADKQILQKEVLSSPETGEKMEKAVAALDLPSDRKLEELRNRLGDEVRFRELNLAGSYRVLGFRNPFADASVSYFHKSVGGYHGAKLRRYQELIEFHLQEELQLFAEVAQTRGLLAGFDTTRLLNMLNTKYVIVDPAAAPLENPNALGNAWFAPEVAWAKDADEEMQLLGSFDPASEVIVDERFRNLIPENLESTVPDSLAAVVLNSYAPNELRYTAQSANGGIIVFSEIHYPVGWQAFVDGNPVEHLRVNYLLRGLAVGPGSHEIEFRFDPESFRKGSLYSKAGSVLVLLLCLGTFLLWLKSAFRPE